MPDNVIKSKSYGFALRIVKLYKYLSADKRELSNAYDSMMTELECTKLNLDCCSEEKLKIEVSLEECCEERNRIRVELDLVKKLLENMALTDKNISHDCSGSYTPVTTSIGHILGDDEAESASKATPSTIEMDSELQECEIKSRSLTSNLSRADDIGTFGEDEASKNLEVIDPRIVCLLLLYLYCQTYGKT